MVEASAPEDIVALADERAAARRARDYRTADELKQRIEAAGWKVVDFGTAYDLEPARPADVVDGTRTLYGSVESVPSRLDEPATTAVTVIVIAADGVALDDTLSALASTIPPGTQVLAVAEPGTPVSGPADEVIGTAVRFGAADALQAALRRTTGEIVIVLEPDRIPADDVVTPFADALGDTSVAVATVAGLASADLRRYQPAGSGDAITTAAGGYAFRRRDLIDKGPIDPRLQLPGSVAAYVGLLLRDEGPESTPRHVRVIDPPLDTFESDMRRGTDHARLARRDAYRIAHRFADRHWLAGEASRPGGRVGDGTDDGEAEDHGDEGDHAQDP